MKWVFGAVAALALGSVVGAQNSPVAIDPAEEHRRAERALSQNQSEVERLIDLRMLHDLGLSPELDEDIVAVVSPSTTRDMDRQRAELDRLSKSTEYLRNEYEKVRQMANRLDEQARARMDNGMGEGMIGDGQLVPPAGSTLPSQDNGAPSGLAALQPGMRQPSGRAGAQPANSAAPAGETSSRRIRPEDLGSLALDPLRAQIHGSKDHLRVAQALFKAGQALMDRAQVLREQGRIDVAKRMDDRAKERLVRAVEELKSLVDEKEPEFVSLFYLGRCREMLFRYSEVHEGLSLVNSVRDYNVREQEVRDPFLQISARDIQKSGATGDVEVLGSWGQAAKTAMEHFRWMNIHANYDVRTKIESLTWPGERKQ